MQVRQMFQSLPAEDRQLQIQMGLDTTGSGNGFVARSIAGYAPADQSVQVCQCTRCCSRCCHVLAYVLQYCTHALTAHACATLPFTSCYTLQCRVPHAHVKLAPLHRQIVAQLWQPIPIHMHQPVTKADFLIGLITLPA